LEIYFTEHYASLVLQPFLIIIKNSEKWFKKWYLNTWGNWHLLLTPSVLGCFYLWDPCKPLLHCHFATP